MGIFDKPLGHGDPPAPEPEDEPEEESEPDLADEPLASHNGVFLFDSDDGVWFIDLNNKTATRARFKKDEP